MSKINKIKVNNVVYDIEDTSKQEILVSGTNIKSINNQSILGEGNITIEGGGGSTTDVQVNGNSITSNGVANIVTETAYDSSTNKIATVGDLPNVPTNVSSFTNDAGYLTSYTETDPVFSASASSGITSSDITNWNNKGTYSKPSGGIPSTDLSSSVQTSLGKADTAIQDISGKQDVLIAGTNISIASDGKTISATDTTYSDATTSTAGLMSSSDKTKLNGIATGATANTGTITGITMNGTSKGTSGVVDLGTVITSHQDLSSYATKTYVDDHIENGVDVIPSYWQTTVDNAIGRVETIQRQKGIDCFNFVWYSDIHLKQSIGDGNYGRNVFSLSKYIADKLNIPLIISTGDSVTNSVESTEQAMRNDFDYFNELSYKIKDKLINCYGNHDGAWGDNREGSSGYLAAYAWHLRPRDYWNDLMRRQTNQVERHYSLDGSYGYIDVKSQKTRVIQLNSFWVGDNDTYYQDGTMIYDYMHHGGYGQAQLSWLANEALSFDEDGWKVILMAHIPPADIDSSSYLTDKAQTRDADILNGILSAYYNEQTYSGSYTYNSSRNEGTWANVSISVDYTNVTHKATIKGFFAGHCHRSRIIKNVLPFPILTITCATNSSYDSQTEGARTNNTTTETAFDIVSVCDDAIYCTRIGVGSDRATIDLQTYDITNTLSHCSTDNNASTIVENSPYSATITADNGYTVSSITVYMGNDNITSTAVSGNNISIASVTDDITITASATVLSNYSITNTLTNCETSNNAQSIVPNSSYTATLTASNGYTFTGGTITVSMGNNDITSTALNGTTISIASVTGNIVIVGTAVAEMTNKMVVDSEDLNKRISSVYTETSGTGCFITNPIEVDITQSCPVQFRGFATNMGTQGSNKNYGNSKVTLFDANNTALATWYISRQETSGNWIASTSGDNIVGDLSTILNASPTAGTLPSASNVKYVVFSPQISASTISSSDLTGLGIYM